MISHLVKIHYFYKNLLLYTQAKTRHIENIVMMTKGESTKVVNFMIPGAGVLMLGRGHISRFIFYSVWSFENG